jgi:hypothetical protein
MFGLGLAIVLIVTTVINLELAQIIIVVLIGTAIGIVWSVFGPARQPKGLAPRTGTPPSSPSVDEPVMDQTEAPPEVDDGVADLAANDAEEPVDGEADELG